MSLEIFHDQGRGYMSPLEPTAQEGVTLRLRAARGRIGEAWVQYSADGSCWKEIPMERGAADATGTYEFWEGQIPSMAERYHYRFMAREAGTAGDGEQKLLYREAGTAGGGAQKILYYGAEGAAEEEPVLSDCFSVIPGLNTPDWAKGIIWYSVMPDSFYNGDVLNDMAETRLKKTVPWGSTLQGLLEYYGGDIQGIISRIDYIKELGAEAVYINPMWTSDSQAGYGPNNYYEISPNYGNEEDFVTLCEKIHEQGMPVMIDAVFSYSQANSIFTNENGHQPLPGAFQSQDSNYSDLFRFEKWPVSYVHKWGGIENDLGSDKARELFWRGEEAVLKRYLRPPYCADGWRFDAINSYAGTDTSLTKIGAEIRRETKGVLPEVLLVGEDFSKEMILSGNWDAAQNSFFIFTALLWFQGGQYDQSWLADRLYKMAKLPRPVMLCMYNNYENHDTKRILSDYETEKYRMKCVLLLQMTFLGSPVIYFGAENGAGKEGNPSSRNSCNWNRGEWNYEIRMLVKALCELRKGYTALKDGVFGIGILDDERQMTVFGRWDETGTVVTMLNQREYDQTVLLELGQYNLCDGSVVTDYLTGQRYVVEDGRALVTVPAGGSVLVTGDAGNYRGRMQLSFGRRLVEVTMPEENGYVLCRKEEAGSGPEAAPKEPAAATPLFGCGYIEADIRREAAGGALVLSEAAAGASEPGETAAAGGALVLAENLAASRIFAAFVEDSLAVYDGAGRLLGKRELPETGKVRLGIGADSRANVWVDGAAVFDTGIVLEHRGQLYGGLALWGDRVALSGVKAGQDGRILAEECLNGRLGRLFSTEKMRGACRVDAGTLTVEAEELSLLLSEEQPSDFTFQTSLEAVKGGFAGVVSYSDDQNGVALVRDTREGDRLVFGYLKGGRLLSCEQVEGDFSGSLGLQLQRIGAVYTAVYFQDGQWKGFSSYLPANLSAARAGLLCEKGAKAEFSYACFGDSIHKKGSVNTPVTPGTEADLPGRAAEGTAASVLEQYEIIGDAGQWEYALGGIRRTVLEGLSQLMVANRTYGDFAIQGTLLLTEGAGSAGISLLRTRIGEDLGDGYLLSLDRSGRLSLMYQGQTLLEPFPAPVGRFGLKLNVIRKGQKLYLYGGQENELLAVVPGITRKRGYLGFYFENACGHVNNYMILDTQSRWMEPVSPWAQHMREKNGGLVVDTGELVMADIKGTAYTSARVSGRIALAPLEAEKEAYGGILFGAAHDVEPQNGGVLAALDHRGTLFFAKGGKRMASAALGEKVSSVYLTVTVREGAYAAYLFAEDEPLLSWKDSSGDGGVISLVSENSKTGFYHFEVEDLTGAVWKKEEKGLMVSRNGVLQKQKQPFVETALGETVYRIEPFLRDGDTCRLKVDVTVHHPQSADCFPVIYIRGNGEKKIGLYTNGAYTCLVDQKRSVIADEDAESTWIYAKQQAGVPYQVCIESGPDYISVWINDRVIYRRQQLSQCLSGDFSNLPILPEIVCVQGETGQQRTELTIVECCRVSI